MGGEYLLLSDFSSPELSTLFGRLGQSKFRSRFQLGSSEQDYIRMKEFEVIEQHAREFVQKRLAPVNIPNDGRQTPMRGHPVFVAQHATATCCRKCLYQWHHIHPGWALTLKQQDYIVRVIMQWLKVHYSE